MAEAVISIQGLRKSYGQVEAVRGIDLEVERGEIFAVLGPNGAGKTTTVEILEGFRDRSAGEIEVLGADPQTASRDWRERIGIVLQTSSLDPYLTVAEALALYAGYYASPRPVDEVIRLVELEDARDRRAGRLSGGQQRRLDVGIALVGDPDLLFLDEPTTGFDPSARRHAWEMIGGLRDLGKTVLLTTHYMEEAQYLADRVAILSQGRIVAVDTPEDLGGRESLPAEISFRLPEGVAVGELSGLAGLPPARARSGGETVLETKEPVAVLNRLTGWALERGVELDNLEVHRPTLEDIYLEMTEGATRNGNGGGGAGS